MRALDQIGPFWRAYIAGAATCLGLLAVLFAGFIHGLANPGPAESTHYKYVMTYSDRIWNKEVGG